MVYCHDKKQHDDSVKYEVEDRKCEYCTIGFSFVREGGVEAEGINFSYCPMCGHPTDYCAR